MTDFPHAKDFKGNSLQIGDVVIYVNRNRNLGNGVIIEIRETLGYHFYTVLDLDYPTQDFDDTSRGELVYTGSDYRGMAKEYILSLHGITKED